VAWVLVVCRSCYHEPFAILVLGCVYRPGGKTFVSWCLMWFWQEMRNPIVRNDISDVLAMNVIMIKLASAADIP
jgi:hypothetical protein